MYKYQLVCQILRHLYLIKYEFMLLLVLFISSCSIHQEVSIDKDRPKFTMWESNKLFFRNMRQPYYDCTELKEANMAIFQLSARDTSSSAPTINVKIVQQWMEGKAFAMIDFNTYMETFDPLQIVWIDSAQQQGLYEFQRPAKQDAHFKFATELYTSIQQGHQLHIITPDSSYIPIFQQKTHREVFRKTMVDFYRLVGLL